jgi:D-alanyl-D-alanine carboxypeptidase
MDRPRPVSFEEALQTLAERDLEMWSDIPGRLLRVLSPTHGIDVEVAAGMADRATGEPLRPGARFRIASVTKTFVAASALRLVEDGHLTLDAPLDRLLPSDYLDVLRGGGYETGAITLRHLLTHTSGIYDFAASAYDASIVDGFDQAVAQDPTHRWTRMEQTVFAMTHGEPYGSPGTVFGYSDTNANLVGEILERITGDVLGVAVRYLLDFERLGLRHTWQESIEPEPPDLPQLSHQYEGEVDVAGIDPSVDLYGGGGLMSTCRDLSRFFRALLRGEVFGDRRTLATMTARLHGIPKAAATGADDDPEDAAMYLFHAQIDGRSWWGHEGWWGTTVYTCPDIDATVVAGHQQARTPKAFRGLDVVREVARLLS